MNASSYDCIVELFRHAGKGGCIEYFIGGYYISEGMLLEILEAEDRNWNQGGYCTFKELQLQRLDWICRTCLHEYNNTCTRLSTCM